MKTIRGKRALITGAASGIGRAIALALAREGAHLYLWDIDDAGLEEVASETGRFGVEVVADHCDLAHPAEITSGLETMRDCWEHLDILINNAGVVFFGKTEQTTDEQWQRLLSINLLAPIQITRALLPMLLERPQAHILNVCSVAGLAATKGFAAYHVSKYGLVGFSEALRAEYWRRGLGVTALCPGLVKTKLLGAAVSRNEAELGEDPPDWIFVSAEKVAAKAVQAVRRNRGVVLVGGTAHLLWNMKRFAPGLVHRVFD